MDTITKIESSFTPYTTGIAHAIEMALDYAADRHPEFEDEVSVASLEVDGQFVKVKIWISNMTDETFVLDMSDPENVIDA